MGCGEGSLSHNEAFSRPWLPVIIIQAIRTASGAAMTVRPILLLPPQYMP
jgi:hypothetical protein